MKNRSPVFEENYRFYIDRIKDIPLDRIASRLGAGTEKDGIVIPFFGRPYGVSAGGITDASGRKPPYFVCIVLFKYILMCPDQEPDIGDWVSFRNFKDAAPLITYFTKRVENDLTDHFSGQAGRLVSACRDIGGYPPELDLSYDVVMMFDALPKIPVLLLFNDQDDEFPAQCSVLFQQQTQDYLDMECVAGLGNVVAAQLIAADKEKMKDK